MAKCEVTSKCRHRAYVVVSANGVSTDVFVATATCRVHVAAVIDRATAVTRDVRIRRAES